MPRSKKSRIKMKSRRRKGTSSRKGRLTGGPSNINTITEIEIIGSSVVFYKVNLKTGIKKRLNVMNYPNKNAIPKSVLKMPRIKNKPPTNTKGTSRFTKTMRLKNLINLRKLRKEYEKISKKKPIFSEYYHDDEEEDIVKQAGINLKYLKSLGESKHISEIIELENLLID
jgi:hypothetical protein